MNNDLIARASKALKPAAPGGLRPAGGPEKDLLARAEAAIASSPKSTTFVAASPPAPRVERVKVPITCSAVGNSYVVIAERRGDELRFVGHEMPGTGGASRLPGRLSGQYRIELAGWHCPLCGDGNAVWLCDCERMQGAMHCHGNTDGRYRCACGRIEERGFISVKTAEVRGTSVAAMPERSGSSRGQPQLKQVSHDR
jgi:hypothetical protein